VGEKDWDRELGCPGGRTTFGSDLGTGRERHGS